MASMNNNFSGNFPTLANGESLHSHQGKLSGSSDLRPNYPTDFDKPVTYNFSVAQGQNPPRSRPNQNENNPGIPLSNALIKNSRPSPSLSPHPQPKFTPAAPAPQPLFQFDAPGGSYTPSPPANPNYNVNSYSNGQNGFASYANPSGQMPGMGSFVDRMHNITDRDMVPQKRRRVEDLTGEGSRAQFNGSSSGVDDDDVVVVGNEQDREVCYGRIEGSQLNAHRIKIVLRRKEGDKTNNIHALDCTREIIGCVDVNTAIGLAPILDSPKMGVRTAARILTRRKAPDDQPHALQIGRHLSHKQLWLRTPLSVEAGIPLHNPHAIEKPSRALQPTSSTYSSYASRSQAPVRTTEEIRNDVLGVFDSLPRSENLPEMEPSSLITTELLKHQKQGLYFMMNREKERNYEMNDKCDLWKLRHGNNGQKIYYNVITGDEERKSPPQVLGGILADMMGLGKTLSILSLVATTLDDSKEWAKQRPSQSDQREQPVLKSGKAASQPIAPLSVISNWEDQIRAHIKSDALKYYIYHGANRIKDVTKLSEYDMVITTYGSVASECNNRNKKKDGKYPLEEMNWLSAQRRWACTGTPVQNRLEDLGALMNFLRVKPFNGSGFAQHILSPFKICDPEIIPKLRLLVDSITLRRLKDKIDLPKRHDQIARLDFSDEELITSQGESALGGKTFHHILQSILRLRQVCAHGKDLLSAEDLKIMNGLSKDSAIDLDSEEYEDHDGMTPKQAYEMYKLMRDTGTDSCLTCNRKIGPQDVVDSDGESKEEVIGYMTPCFHIICGLCIGAYKSQLEELAVGGSLVGCPTCHQQISPSMFFSLKQEEVDKEEESRLKTKESAKAGKDLSNYGGPHTKTIALIHDLLASRKESQARPNEPPIKSVVFSGWTTHLDLIQLALQENNIPYTRLDGKMTRIARSMAMENFREDPSIVVILVSIAAGGLGLNLTTANKVYVMEPQFNPAAEAQAIDRVHRLGQKREVQTVRFIMNKSFEEKMLQIQDKKQKLASLSMDSQKGRLDKKEASIRRLEELKDLFRK
ncbi:SNF2 family domain-containing protein [Botrytis cinerea]